MQKLFFLFLSWLVIGAAQAQTGPPLTGTVTDAASGERLPGASISLYTAGALTGMVSNAEGKFMLAATAHCDSLKVSMIGYHSKTFYTNDFTGSRGLIVQLARAPAVLQEVIVKARNAIDIVKLAIAGIDKWLPAENFENRCFYREIIKDRNSYFSVAEAVFRAQYHPQKHVYALQLVEGRSKEDVSYTRLFEDFHPGGGPQAAVANDLILNRPDFLDLKKINQFTYAVDSVELFDGQLLYSISFDQKPGIKQALEKGRLLINTEDYSIARYEAANSPAGTPYIKSLTGTDKLFARLLNIDFTKKGWQRRADFTLHNGKRQLQYSTVSMAIAYKQPKKNIDLDLQLDIELVMTDLQLPFQKEIAKEEEWENKNMVAHLPWAFDSSFWGNNNTISATAALNQIVKGISAGSYEQGTAASALPGWENINRHFFMPGIHADTITLVPLMNCAWEDDETGGLIHKPVKGDFTVITKIRLQKNTDSAAQPDRGFQQAGIMIRSSKDSSENYILLSMGTGGNPKPKVFFKKTIAGKSKTVLEKIDSLTGWLKIVKQGKMVSAYFSAIPALGWTLVGSYEPGWLLQDGLQLGLAVFARFPGDGPKMHPDMKAIFTEFQIEKK